VPAGQPVDVALRDGSTVRVRPVRAGDLDGLRELLAGMSEDSRWLRFLSAGVNLDKAAHSAADSDDGAGLVVTAGSPERIVAHAMYVKETPERAEVAFEVADAWHGRGIATILLAHLAGEATRTGVTTFVAYIHPTNRRMIGVFRQSGFPVEVRSGAGEIHVEMPAALGEAARLRFEDRGRAAAAAAVEHVLRPASVALVTTGGTATGATVLRNLRAAGYGGELRIVVADLEDPQPQPAVELALLAVPPATVLDHARACGEAGVRAIVVLTGGFLGSGDEGRDRLRELLAICRRSGMRLVGPSSLGVMNTDPRVRLNATSVAVTPPAGPIALASQSGAIGVAAITEAARRGFGLSSFVATGDKADLSGNDFLQYWEGDDATRVVLLYLESFGNPRRFATIARRVAGQKPIVAVKSGRLAAGQGTVGTRIATLLGASDVTVDALFEHAGVIRTETVSEQLDVAALLASQPLPGGDRVGIVSNARGPAISCADACAAAGLRAEAPVDLGAGATPRAYAAAIERLAGDADAIIVVFVPALETGANDVVARLDEVAGEVAGAGTTLLGAVMAQSEAELAALGRGGGVPLYRSPVEAARVLAHVARYARWRLRPLEDPGELDRVDPDAAAAVIAAALARGEGWLRPDEVDALLAAYGIGVRRMAAEGVEMVAGVLSDPDFGPVVACGLGGHAATLLGDVAVRLAPVARADAAALVRSLRSFPLLDGYQGAPVADVPALEDVLVRISALAAAHPEVLELDCDPLLVDAEGAVAVDARIRVRTAAVARPFPALDR
jgi:acyl-CoA synthetase (NDP forming)/L-amino acid N-acyltransferase YncA